MHNTEKLATYFRNLKEERNLTQVEMAQVTGVAQSTISKLLNGQHVQARSVDKIATALGINLRELYIFTGAIPPVKKYNPDGTLSREWLAQMICHELAELNPDHQQQILDMIREFAVRNS